MASTIDISYFFGPLLIAQKSESSVGTAVQALIDKLEPAMLTDLLGYELYKAYAAAITAGSPAVRYTDLRDGKEYTDRRGVLTKWNGLIFTTGTTKQSPIANYIYWHWLKKQASETTGTGEKTLNNQNASNTSPIRKQVAAWNEMVDMNWQLIEFLLSNPTVYPEFTNHYAQSLFYKLVGNTRIKNGLLYKQNIFNF